MESVIDSINARCDLVHLSELPGVTVPAYVADYTPLDKEAASKLPAELFADPDSMSYPIDSKGATWLSAGLFQIKQGSIQPEYTPAMSEWVWGNIMKAAHAFDITTDVQQLTDAVKASMTKTAEPSDNDYGWLVKNAENVVVARRYPMFDADGVMKAAVYFDENRRHYPHAVRREISSNIMRKAAQYGVAETALPDSVAREAGEGLPRSSIIMRELIHRARMSKDAEAGIALLNLNEVLNVATPQELSQNLDKLAELIEDFDHVEGVAGAYGTKVTFPADILHSVREKVAEAAVSDGIMLAAKLFSKTALAQLDAKEAFEPILGSDFTTPLLDKDGKLVKDALSKALENLPAADQFALVDHLRATYA